MRFHRVRSRCGSRLSTGEFDFNRRYRLTEADFAASGGGVPLVLRNGTLIGTAGGQRLARCRGPPPCCRCTARAIGKGPNLAAWISITDGTVVTPTSVRRPPPRAHRRRQHARPPGRGDRPRAAGSTFGPRKRLRRGIPTCRPSRQKTKQIAPGNTVEIRVQGCTASSPRSRAAC